MSVAPGIKTFEQNLALFDKCTKLAGDLSDSLTKSVPSLTSADVKNRLVLLQQVIGVGAQYNFNATDLLISQTAQ